MEMTHPIPLRLSTQHSEESEESLAQTNLDHWEYGLKPREIKAEEWGQHAQNFRNLYLTDGLKLDDVRRLMYTEHGFYATSVFPIYKARLTDRRYREAQYKYRLKTIWKIQKTIPKRKILAMLQIEHRRLQGPGKKLTLFYWHGKPVDKNHLERSRNRLRFSGADDVSVGKWEKSLIG